MFLEQNKLEVLTFRVALVAQSVEHQTFNLRVEGSSPFQGLQFFETYEPV